MITFIQATERRPSLFGVYNSWSVPTRGSAVFEEEPSYSSALGLCVCENECSLNR